MKILCWWPDLEEIVFLVAATSAQKISGEMLINFRNEVLTLLVEELGHIQSVLQLDLTSSVFGVALRAKGGHGAIQDILRVVPLCKVSRSAD